MYALFRSAPILRVRCPTWVPIALARLEQTGLRVIRAVPDAYGSDAQRGSTLPHLRSEKLKSRKDVEYERADEVAVREYKQSTGSSGDEFRGLLSGGTRRSAPGFFSRMQAEEETG